MNKNSKLLVFVIGGTLILAAAVGLLLVSETTSASAAAESWVPSSQVVSTIYTEVGETLDDINHRGRRGVPLPGTGTEKIDYLADALGITPEELQTAHENASQAALDQALSEGLITQEQYDMMVLRGFGFFGRGGMKAPGGSGGIDFDALLAGELNISVETLQDAREQAADMAIEQAIADGKLTQEQADMIAARKALQDYIDMDALLTQSLGLNMEELRAAREAGKSFSDILAEQGMTSVEFRDALEAAHQAAIQQAVQDGVITAEQAEQFQDGFRGLPLMDGFRAPHGKFGGGCSGFGFPQEAPRADTNSDI